MDLIILLLIELKTTAITAASVRIITSKKLFEKILDLLLEFNLKYSLAYFNLPPQWHDSKSSKDSPSLRVYRPPQFSHMRYWRSSVLDFLDFFSF